MGGRQALDRDRCQHTARARALSRHARYRHADVVAPAERPAEAPGRSVTEPKGAGPATPAPTGSAAGDAPEPAESASPEADPRRSPRVADGRGAMPRPRRSHWSPTTGRPAPVSGCTPAQLRRFIKSRAYLPVHEIRRRFGIETRRRRRDRLRRRLEPDLSSACPFARAGSWATWSEPARSATSSSSTRRRRSWSASIRCGRSRASSLTSQAFSGHCANMIVQIGLAERRQDDTWDVTEIAGRNPRHPAKMAREPRTDRWHHRTTGGDTGDE